MSPSTSLFSLLLCFVVVLLLVFKAVERISGLVERRHRRPSVDAESNVGDDEDDDRFEEEAGRKWSYFPFS